MLGSSCRRRFWRKVAHHPQRLQEIGAAAPAADRPVVVFGDADTGGAGDDGCRGGNVEGPGAIATRPGRVERRTGSRDEESGIRLWHALVVVPFVLLRVWARRALYALAGALTGAETERSAERGAVADVAQATAELP